MKIFVIGTARDLQECRARFGNRHTVSGISDSPGGDYDVLFDFRLVRTEVSHRDAPLVFFNTVIQPLSTIAEMLGAHRKGAWFGFNGLPSFILNKEMEVCCANETDIPKLEEFSRETQVGYTLVKDQPGLVSPRIISMIINEAYRTLEEKTASRSDIDLAMKLGTNYPLGPFEWCEKIGIAVICQLLESLEQVTGDQRFRPCRLLKEEARFQS